jgi:hypothetical protein
MKLYDRVVLCASALPDPREVDYDLLLSYVRFGMLVFKLSLEALLPVAFCLI